MAVKRSSSSQSSHMITMTTLLKKLLEKSESKHLSLITVLVEALLRQDDNRCIYFYAIMKNTLQRCIAWGFSVIFYFRVLLKVFKSARYIKAILLGGSCGLCHSLIISQSLGAVTCSHTVTSLQADNDPFPQRSTWSPDNVIHFNVKGHTGRNFNFDFIVLFSR